MGRCGILGGTFNPIHIGHLMIAEQAYSEFSLKRVLIMPSGNSYFKQDMDVPPGKVRLEMCKIAAGDNPHFEVSDIEVLREGKTYTYETLEELKFRYPKDEFYFICGADIVRQIKLWKNPEKIFQNCIVLAAVRDDTDEIKLCELIEDYKKSFSARIKIMHTPRMDISSTSIRNMIERNRSTKYYLPDALSDYIKKNHIYK